MVGRSLTLDLCCAALERVKALFLLQILSDIKKSVKRSILLACFEMQVNTINYFVEHSITSSLHYLTMPSYRASMSRRSARKTEEDMLQPLLSEDDDDSTAASGSDSSASTEFEQYKPTLKQQLKQALGE